MKILWTDGSANPNPGPGGFAVIEELEDGSGRPVCLGRNDKTSNIRMEGLALLSALRHANHTPCEIHTDSEFWVNVLTKWAPNWAKNHWQKPRGEIKNLDIVIPLYETYINSHAELIWVRAHVGTPLNEMADEYANYARKKLNKQGE